MGGALLLAAASASSRSIVWRGRDGSNCWPARRGTAGRNGSLSSPTPSSCRRRAWAASLTGRTTPRCFSHPIRSAGTSREYEETMELRPGLERLAAQLVHVVEHLGHGRPAQGIARQKLEGNPYWPEELARHAGQLAHERYVVIAPLALSRTQDDKGRVRWTLFGGSEHGPAKAFWKGFFTGTGARACGRRGPGFFPPPAGRRLRAAARATSRFAQGRISHPAGAGRSVVALRARGAVAVVDGALSAGRRCAVAQVRYLLTFRPFGALPKTVRRAYLAGKLALLPFPGSLVFWGEPPLLRLRHELPLAMQIPLLNVFERHEDPHSIRVPQSGWMHEPHPDHPEPYQGELQLRNTYRRTHRWARIHRHEDELAVADGEDRVANVLFSTAPDDVGLYGKPMARNAQIWTHDFHLLLDGPRADVKALERAAAALRKGGLFGYRFVFPAMQVGRHEVYWHRPLVACLGAGTSTPELVPHAPLGYMTAYAGAKPDTDRPVELWPRHPGAAAARRVALRVFADARTSRAQRIDQQRPQGARSRRAVARGAVAGRIRPGAADHSSRANAGRVAAARRGLDQLRPRRKRCWLRNCGDGSLRRPRCRRRLTYHRTATRSFEAAYWRTIARLAFGAYVQKDNGDCARDPISQSLDEASPPRPRSLGRLSVGLLSPAGDQARNGRAGDRRRSALPLGDAVSVPVARADGSATRKAVLRNATCW